MQKLQSEKNIEDIKRETSILEHLAEQPNIIEFKGAYEDKQNLHLVNELCSVGELFDQITAKGSRVRSSKYLQADCECGSCVSFYRSDA